MGKKVKVVFDSNVWISIFMRKVLAQDFSKVIDQQATVYVTQEIIIEISKVLVYPRITRSYKRQTSTPRQYSATSPQPQP